MKSQLHVAVLQAVHEWHDRVPSDLGVRRDKYPPSLDEWAAFSCNSLRLLKKSSASGVTPHHALLHLHDSRVKCRYRLHCMVAAMEHAAAHEHAALSEHFPSGRPIMDARVPGSKASISSSSSATFVRYLAMTTAFSCMARHLCLRCLSETEASDRSKLEANPNGVSEVAI